MRSTPDAFELAGLNLNLLRVLDALLSERHVTRAAARLGLSQSATSHALGRLRAAIDDPLLVRGRRGLVPTARAEALAEPLRRALVALAEALTPPATFDPLTTRRTFTIAAADYAQFVVLPPLLARLTREAPGLDLVARDFGGQSFPDLLATGACDLAIGPPVGGVRGARGQAQTQPVASAIRERRLFGDRFVCVVRADHPKVKKRLDLATFVALPHAFIAPRGTQGGIVDDVLAEHGHTRRVALMVQQFLVAPWAIAESDLVITLAERLAIAFAAHLPLKLLEPPITLPRFAMHLAWHERQQRDEAHQWLRNLLVDACRTL